MKIAFSNFIFDYGSLICPKLRTITAPTSEGRQAIPVRVKHLQRIWSIRMDGVTYLGIRPCRKECTNCVGVLIPVTDTELDYFDMRECGYDRMKIDPNHVQELVGQPSPSHL